MRRVLEISGATRAHLDEIWSGGLPPPSLVEALERFKVELGLAEVAATQKEDRLLSTDTQRVLFCLVPHLGHWPEDLCLRVHDADGELQQVYGRRQQLGLFKRSVSIRQLARGGFVEQTETLLDTSTALAHEAGVLDLILGLLPGDSQPSARDPVVRRAWLKAARQQLGALAMAHSTEVFEALGIHSGRLKVDATTSASGSEVLSYLPVFISDLPKAVVTLRSLYPHLSLSRLAHFLRDNPLSSSQARELLEYRRLPYRLRYALDREQQFSALGCVLDGIYQVRRFHEPTDAWVQCIASEFSPRALGQAADLGRRRGRRVAHVGAIVVAPIRPRHLQHPAGSKAAECRPGIAGAEFLPGAGRVPVGSGTGRAGHVFRDRPAAAARWHRRLSAGLA
ncbi:hypothetical protein [Pseudomonas asplenii]|uniref:hypothetical protein n=1 Tax=Pseudomonas asplenii TaxID=53407 RepID=UPI000300159A|nr:hypothetical protein [Pseudomonas fuscovaginae]